MIAPYLAHRRANPSAPGCVEKQSFNSTSLIMRDNPNFIGFDLAEIGRVKAYTSPQQVLAAVLGLIDLLGNGLIFEGEYS